MTKPSFYVGIGASAGGLEPLEKVFSALPPDTGMAFIVVQHLSPDFKSLMDEILSRHTTMKVNRVENGMEVLANEVYLIPPKKEMIISGGRLLLADKDPDISPSMPIDLFLRSLAADVKDQAVAVILSGSGSDGSRGIRDVHFQQGLVVAQSKESSHFDSMPGSAIETGVVDIVADPERIPDILVNHVKTLGQPRPQAEEDPETLDETFSRIFGLLRESYKIDFAYYKRSTIGRRIERRMHLLNLSSLTEFADVLSRDAEELDRLYKDLLIGVTAFFRDYEAFRSLEVLIGRRLVDRAPGAREFRVWVPGCASGEEAYSLAIVLLEAMAKAKTDLDIKIFATDAHKESLARAAHGVYPLASVSDLPPAYLDKYFLPAGEDAYQVGQDIRRLVIFAEHDLLKDPPFTKLDLISCRNLLIYFQPVAQKKVCSLFHFGLKPKGILFMGPSESLGDLEDEFDPGDRHWKIFTKKRDVRLPLAPRFPLSQAPTLHVRTRAGAQAGMLDQRLLRVYDSILDQYMPTGALVNERRELIHAFGDARRYLFIPSGRATPDLMSMVGGDARIALASAFQRADKTGEPVTYRSVKIAALEGEALISLTVTPILDRLSGEKHYLATFEEERPLLQACEAAPSDFDARAESRERITELENEIQSLRESLQATIEELETSNEELQSSNEELLASNEELQSTNEELHSVNEELFTVNSEYETKITELVELNADMDNLLRTTEIGTVFLDSQLRIRKFTPAVTRLFNVMPHDIGRPFHHISHSVPDLNLLSDVRQVLESSLCVQKEVRNAQGAWFLMRVLPYLGEGGRTEGVVLTFVDVTAMREAAEGQRRLSTVVNDSNDAITVVSFAGEIQSWNRGAEVIYGWKAEEAVGQRLTDLMIPPGRQEETLRLIAQARQGDPVEVQETTRLTRDGRTISVVLTLTALLDETGHPSALVSTERDVTESQRIEQALRASEHRFRNLFETMAQGVLFQDRQGTVILANAMAGAILGLRREELVGRPASELMVQAVHEDGSPMALAERAGMRALAQGQPVKGVAMGLPIPGGGTRWLVADAIPQFRDGESTPYQVFTVFKDITEERRIQAALREAREEALSASRAKSEFLANMSHEIRTPLNGILGMLQLLDFTTLSGEQQEFVGIARNSGQNLLSIISDILDLSKIESGLMELDEGYFDLGELIETAIKEFAPQAQAKGLSIGRDMRPDACRHLVGAPMRIRQVLGNLINNAVKFTETGGIRVEAWTSPDPSASDGQIAFFRVSDSGVGIPAGKMDAVFEPFSQVDGSYTRRFKGVGLGLSIVRKLVGLMGGEVRVESQPSQGASFTFSVRCRGLAAPAVTATRPLAEASRPLRVLLAEDELVNRLFAKTLLVKMGHEAAEAETGAQAIEILRRERFDLVLMDIQMPDMDGIEAARSIRQDESLGDMRRVPIVALTAHALVEDREQALASGMDDFLTKPFGLEDMRGLLARFSGSENGDGGE
jgi:two-component system CheB/CheR fusion protein